MENPVQTVPCLPRSQVFAFAPRWLWSAFALGRLRRVGVRGGTGTGWPRGWRSCNPRDGGRNAVTWWCALSRICPALWWCVRNITEPVGTVPRVYHVLPEVGYEQPCVRKVLPASPRGFHVSARQQ